MTKKMIRKKTNYAENTKIMTIMIDDEKDEKEDYCRQRHMMMTKKTGDDKEN